MTSPGWPRRIGLAVVAVVATPAVFVAGMSLIPDDEPLHGAASVWNIPTDAEPTAVAAQITDDGRLRYDTRRDVRLAAYDRKAGKARVTPGKSGARPVTKGDIIASARTKELPQGALIRVTEAPDDKGLAQVVPATLPDLLGDAKIDTATPVKPSDITLKPLLAGVSGAVSAAAEPTAQAAEPAAPPVAGDPAEHVRSTVTAPAEAIAPAPLVSNTATGRHAVGGQLKLDLDIPLAELGFQGTGRGGPTLAGWVHFQPQVIFAYTRQHALSLAPSEASIGIGGAYDYGWKLHAAFAGSIDTGRQPLRVPFAEVHVHTTLWVGGFPIVVDADLTYFYQVAANGKISIDAEQKTTGDVSLGAHYTKAGGWTRLPLSSSTTTPVRDLRVTGAATATATIGAHLKVALYGMVGAVLEWAPFVRAGIDATAGAQPWALYAGFDLRGALFVQLRVFGITVLDKTLPLPPLHAEWKVAGG